jgi:hypothetical protein
MNTTRNPQPSSDPRILMFSHKNIFEQAVWRCPFHEFQTIIQEVDSVDVLAPQAKSWYTTGKRVALRVGEFVSMPLNPGVSQVEIGRDYDMFLTVCESASDLLHLQAIKGWRDRCKMSVCWLPEFYIKDMEVYKSCVKILRQFDYVVFMFVGNEPFKRIIKGKGFYLHRYAAVLSLSQSTGQKHRCSEHWQKITVCAQSPVADGAGRGQVLCV